MGSVDLSPDRNLAVRAESEPDAAQLRAAMKLSDGADELALAPGATLTFSVENPFNVIALWGTDFHWSRDALALALDAMAPLARSSLHIHTRSHQVVMRRFLPRFDPPKSSE